MYYPDNIVAIATAPENGAIGVLRISGPDAGNILKRIFFTKSGKAFSAFQARYFHFGHLLDCDGQLVDEALAVLMPGPNSFTGEDVVEIHCHGNLILLKRVVQLVLALCTDFLIRPASPGEFTKRAYLNRRMDLTKAEAVHEIITATSDAALASSLSNLDGRLKQSVESIREDLKVCLALIEASFEFPEEDIQIFDPKEVAALVKRALSELTALSGAFQTSKLYDQGVSVALVGKPNVGKSSLLNAILFEDRAIVTDVAGTTRDVVEGQKMLNGIRFIFRDTAGLRSTTDAIESAGIAKSRECIARSDIVLYLVDNKVDANSPEFPELSQPAQSSLLILNKVDAVFPDLNLDEDSPVTEFDCFENFSNVDLFVSAKWRFGLAKLEQCLHDLVLKNVNVQNNVHVNARQHQCLADAISILEPLKTTLCDEGSFPEEIISEELRRVVIILAGITGEITSDAILGEIFSRFCIGK